MRYVEDLEPPGKFLMTNKVHILNESRGSTLEVVISRMKLRGSAVRFILVSATVPNIEDIASWIGSSSSKDPARVYQVSKLSCADGTRSYQPSIVWGGISTVQTQSCCYWSPKTEEQQ